MMKYIIYTLYILLILAMGAATVVEKLYGAASANSYIYDSWVFAGAWAALVVISLLYLLRKRIQRRPFTFLLHLSLMVILAGAGLTEILALRGRVHLRQGETTGIYYDEDYREHPLPFAISLEEFDIETYAGTDMPKDFICKFIILDGFGGIRGEGAPLPGYTGTALPNLTDGDSVTGRVSMNKVYDYKSFRFFMSGYDDDMQGATLRISHDPWGMTVTYIGYALLLVSMILFFFDRKSEFRNILRVGLTVSALFMAIGINAAPVTISAEQADAFGKMYVEYNGRICPIKTLARDLTIKLYGSDSYQGMSSAQVLAGWTLFPDKWIDVPTKKIKQTDPERARMEEREIEQLKHMAGSAKLIRIFPYTTEGTVAWASPSDWLPSDVDPEQRIFIKRSLDYLTEEAIKGDDGKFDEVLGKLFTYQKKQGLDTLPSDGRMQAEIIYDDCHHERSLAICCFIAGLLLMVLLMRSHHSSRGIIIASYICSGTAFAVITAMLCLRAYISGHVPMTNGYETMMFMGWCALALTLFSISRVSLAAPFGLIVAGLSVMVASMGESNPQITALMPVLASPLLSVHVALVMLAYSLFAFVMLGGIAGLIYSSKGNIDRMWAMVRLNRLMLYVGVFVMAAGIFVGAIWANQSWGRYWGWDPKETWALITFMIYAIALHSRTVKAMQKPKIFLIFCILAFFCVIITYFGVNFLLGGLHSYA